MSGITPLSRYRPTTTKLPGGDVDSVNDAGVVVGLVIDLSIDDEVRATRFLNQIMQLHGGTRFKFENSDEEYAFLYSSCGDSPSEFFVWYVDSNLQRDHLTIPSDKKIIITSLSSFVYIDDLITTYRAETSKGPVKVGEIISLNSRAGIKRLQRFKDGMEFKFKGFFERGGICTFNIVELSGGLAILHSTTVC